MDKRLYKAAMEGSTETLLLLIQQDPLLLDRANSITAAHLETPLHIAAMLGHVDFAAELLRRKPGLAREPDSRGSSPLHLAAAKGHVAIVRALLGADRGACFACDRDGRNPVHVAAVMGRVGALKEMLAAEPDAGRVVMKDGGTVLHLCVVYGQFEALRNVLESLEFGELVNCRDRKGDTALHLAVADKQIETVELLLSVPRTDCNAVNLAGMTAIDILTERRSDTRDLEIEQTLKRAGAIAGANKNATTSFLHRSKDNPNLHHPHKDVPSKKSNINQADWLDKKRSALMVVASLIATMAFQAGVNPPTKIWPEKDTGTPINNPKSAMDYATWVSRRVKKGEIFYMMNTVSFVASLSIILLLMSGLPLRSRFFVWVLLMITWVAISGIALSYAVAVVVLTPEWKEREMNGMVGFTVFVWICLVTLLLLGHTVRLFVMMVRVVLVAPMMYLFRRMRRGYVARP